MRYDKKIKIKIWKFSFFRLKNIFRTILKNRKFQKVTFSKNNEKNRKSQKFNFFRKKLDFWDFQLFSTFFEKVTFWNFRFFEIFRKIFFNRKNEIFLKIFNFHFFIVSHVYPQLVASRNSHCAARGRNKRLSENQKKHVFCVV